jgi:hypothetical protein
MLKCFHLEGNELYEQVSDLFNRQHEVKFSEDQCGYGGRIREKRVARFLEEQGSVLVKDRLGVRASPHLALPILPISISATTSSVPLTSMHARATPLPPVMHYTHEATVDFTVTTSFEIENYNHRKCREAPDKIGWSTYGLLSAAPRRRLLQYYKLNHMPKIRKLHRQECRVMLRLDDNDRT